MNEATRWRTVLGQSIATAYARNPKVGSVLLGGSVARGWADPYADIELFVFWQAPPSDEDRLQAVKQAGGIIDIWWHTPPDGTSYRRLFEERAGRLGQAWPYEDEEWAEHFYVRGVEIGVSGFLSSTIETYLTDVVGRLDTTESKHFLLATITDGIPLVGADQFTVWQRHARAYPEALARALIAEQLALEPRWWDCEKLAARGEYHVLYPLFSQMVGRLARLILALNRRYVPDPRLKWLAQLLTPLPIRPAGTVTRLQQLYQLAPLTAARELQGLFDETLDLVEQHLPGTDISFARHWYRHRRVVWGHSPAGLEEPPPGNTGL